jgi:hypothetical protein
MMRIAFLIGAALIAAPAAAQEDAAKAPTQEELKAADQTLSLLVSALNSKDVPQETKNGLFGCMYENSLGTIGSAATKALAENKQIDPENATQRLLVLAKVCGAPVPMPADNKSEGAVSEAEPKTESR